MTEIEDTLEYSLRSRIEKINYCLSGDSLLMQNIIPKVYFSIDLVAWDTV